MYEKSRREDMGGLSNSDQEVGGGGGSRAGSRDEVTPQLAFVGRAESCSRQ